MEENNIFDGSLTKWPRINNYPEDGDGSLLYLKLIEGHIYIIRCREAGKTRDDYIVRYSPTATQRYMFKKLYKSLIPSRG